MKRREFLKFLSSVDKIKLSKLLSYILRHNPEKFNLKMDSQGFVDLKELVKAVSSRYPEVDEKIIQDLVNTSEKKRFEIVNNKIRATYGHSINIDLNLPEITPPEFLYHGTSKETLEEIRKNGLQPMGRQYVHLSQTKEEAYQVGLRRDEKPIILKIKAKEAYLEGIKFFKADKIYLVKEILARFIELGKEAE